MLESVRYFAERDCDLRRLSVADQGAGRLRHLDMLARHFGCTYAVDTRKQLYRHQELFGRVGRGVDVARVGRDGWLRTRPVTAAAFDRTNLCLDVVFSACVYDAVPSYDRPRLARAAFRNLKQGGTYVVIAPRNDSSILARCQRENAYDDGHVFTRYGSSTTFFANFRSTDRLLKILAHEGFEMMEDRSIYRYVWLFLKRTH